MQTTHIYAQSQADFWWLKTPEYIIYMHSPWPTFTCGCHSNGMDKTSIKKPECHTNWPLQTASMLATGWRHTSQFQTAKAAPHCIDIYVIATKHTTTLSAQNITYAVKITPVQYTEQFLIMYYDMVNIKCYDGGWSVNNGVIIHGIASQLGQLSLLTVGIYKYQPKLGCGELKSVQLLNGCDHVYTSAKVALHKLLHFTAVFTKASKQVHCIFAIFPFIVTSF